MDGHAVRTLRTRAFFRSFASDEVPKTYYEYVSGRVPEPWTDSTYWAWKQASDQACQLRLGDPGDDRVLDERIGQIARSARRQGLPWVLVGGPPCQAFSLVGRARNRGVSGYVAEDDDRHYLYQHYLHILSKYRPAAFVLENVKGMLSSQVGGARIFDEIFAGLNRPGGTTGPRYRIEPIVEPASSGVWNPGDFIVRSELLGVPQSRHRVVLVGIREGEGASIKPLNARGADATVGGMILGLPRLRSGCTDRMIESWSRFTRWSMTECARLAKQVDSKTSSYLRALASQALAMGELGTGGQWSAGPTGSRLPLHLDRFIRDPRLRGVLQHQSRNHMSSDLLRYGYAAAYAHANGRSPRGAREFPAELHPNHSNWGKSDRFVDRFKVQRFEDPSSTITSHLAKDGHYFIHPDVLQMRSLTVREAARLQTFPDNYFFEGPLGAQRKQVGNAVPPWLGHQIADIVYSALA